MTSQQTWCTGIIGDSFQHWNTAHRSTVSVAH